MCQSPYMDSDERTCVCVCEHYVQFQHAVLINACLKVQARQTEQLCTVTPDQLCSQLWGVLLGKKCSDSNLLNPRQERRGTLRASLIQRFS